MTPSFSRDSSREYSRDSSREGSRDGGYREGGREGSKDSDKGPFKRKRRDARSHRKKPCPWTAAGILDIDYKDTENLRKFITSKGKILPRRITGVSARHQREMTRAIKQARYMALLPFTSAE